MTVDYNETVPAVAHGGRFNPDPPHLDVIHSTEGPMSRGNALAVATNWFGVPASQGGAGTSTTGIFDPGNSVRMLDEHTVPYHVGPVGNGLSTGDEHCGSVKLTPEQWMSADGQEMLDRSAKVKAQRAHARGWSLAECRWLTLTQIAARNVNGFCTHNDIRLALGGTTHSDPGPNFPYKWYMERVRFWYQNPNGIPAPSDVWEDIMALYNTAADFEAGMTRAFLSALDQRLGRLVMAQDGRSNSVFNGDTVATLPAMLDEHLTGMHDALNTIAQNTGTPPA